MKRGQRAWRPSWHKRMVAYDDGGATDDNSRTIKSFLLLALAKTWTWRLTLAHCFE